MITHRYVSIYLVCQEFNATHEHMKQNENRVFPGRAWYVLSFLCRQNKLRFAVIRIPTEDAVSKENARSNEN